MTNNNVRGGLDISMTKVFKKLRQERSLNLSLVKEHALIDFVSCYPSILARSVCPSSVAKGFLCNGIIDEKMKHWPNMKAMLRICENIKLTEEKEENVAQSFPKLHAEQMEKGYLSNDFLENLGLLPDKNFSGETVR